MAEQTNHSMVSVQWVGFTTIVSKEIVRFLRIWSQTLLPSAITTTLYFVIFGHLIGQRVGLIDGVTYMQYIVPGLVMMAIITSAYSNVSSSFFGLKFQRSIDELVISPLSHVLVMLGFVMGGVVRGLLVGIIVTIIALCFTHLHVTHISIMLTVAVLSAIMFSLAGFFNALFAKKFDDVMLVPTFILTPLTYLGGVFYSISMLPPFWQKVSLLNPILYLVNAFRFGVFGVSDIDVAYAFVLIVVITAALFFICWRLLYKGYGIRS